MFISPMLLHKFVPPFDYPPFKEDDYITELKLDGIRLLLSKFDNKIRLYTRHNNEVTSLFPELLNLKIPDGTVIDGELVVTDSEGKPDFEEVMSRFQAGKKGSQKIEYCVFDILYRDGKKITHLPLLERKAVLSSVLEPAENLAIVQWVQGNGEAYFNLTRQHGLEGIVMKRSASKYAVNSRSHDWLKVINYSETECYVLGKRKKEFGLLLGLEEEGKIRPAGVMEFMNSDARKEFYKLYPSLIIKENKDFIYLEPKIKVKVKFRNFTKAGNIRIPSFVEFVSK